MVPISIEEQIICWADKFFSKKDDGRLKTQGIKSIKFNTVSKNMGRIK